MTPRSPTRHRLSMLGLRGRATLAFATVALALSATVAVTVWYSVSNYLLGQREGAAVRQATSHADLATQALQATQSSPARILEQLPRQLTSTSLLRYRDEWSASALTVARQDLPDALVDAVAAGQPSSQRVTLSTGPVLVVGVPVTGSDASYFEVFPLQELDQTFTALSTVLLAALLFVPLATLVVGWWALRPALRPLDRVAAVAAAVAAGDVTVRLDPRGDPALMPIAESFNSTAEALEHRVRADARFAADVSHELRSPLTTMTNALGLVELHRRALPPEGREMLDLLDAELERFRQLVEDLLEISRSDAGSGDLVLEPLVVHQLASHALPPPLRPLLRVTNEARAAVVWGDKRRLERVLLNLADNAERHGGGLTRVVVDQQADWVTVTVEDDGPGMDADELDRIFERFARGRRTGTGATRGGGLGLSLVARHLTLLGGSVTAENRPDGGARFTVRLPSADGGDP